MEIRELKTELDEVNRKGSKTWLMMNDNSKAAFLRQRFVEKNGGSFYREGRCWAWRSPVEEKNGYWLKRADTGEKVFFDSMTEFGKKNGLTPVKICELLNGKRKTYKGWTAVELRQVKETTGSNIKAKEKEKEKVKIFEGAMFQNMITKEVFHVDNISKYAKDNNMSGSNLYKVARGKAKSYRNLKLYNPLEP
ncbi:hypothetical protein EBU91_02865 [bacterium]|nr:hypothetical protein [bacterium]